MKQRGPGMCPWGSLQGAVPAGDQMGLGPLKGVWLNPCETQVSGEDRRVGTWGKGLGGLGRGHEVEVWKDCE